MSVFRSGFSSVPRSERNNPNFLRHFLSAKNEGKKESLADLPMAPTVDINGPAADYE